ncbi:LPS biosynthesis protein [Psychromonas hadalis]|uniref:LPS biosynthesis protein n=1 Tax=Psychromonas hadalis TaxID=211669 RepID=UPI0003B6752B|nr:LPS biosynthesis protein [Psychromonas hadalis]
MPEQRFIQLRNTLKAEDFNSVEFLKQKAQQLKASDTKLSERILVRVKNLEKQKNQLIEKCEGEKTKKPTSLQTVKPSNVKTRLQSLKQSNFMWFVVLPSLLFAFYQVFIATERFESQAQIIVQQPDAMATMDAGMALLTGMGVSTGGSDTELIKAYINSYDMLQHLNKALNLRRHYSQPDIDYFSRLQADDTREELFDYYQARVSVVINDKSGIISIYSQGFDSDYAQQLTNEIVKRAEWFINSIGHQLASAQLAFVQQEHENIEGRLRSAQINLLNFQQKYNLLDPTAEGMAMQQITYTLEGKIAEKQTELKIIKAIMSNKAPQVLVLNNELKALESQLKNERSKLAQSGQDAIPVSEILSRFTGYKIKMELALQAYTSSQISLEKSRIEAYRQIKYLIVVEQATLSEENKYPDVIYNISLFLLLLSMAFGIGRIIVSTIQELK